MSSRVLEVVVYLMDQLRETQGILPNIEFLSVELINQGYTETEISVAYSWVLDRYEIFNERSHDQFPSEHFSSRVLTQYERMQYSSEAYGYLLKLLNLQVIDDQQFESILDRASVFGPSSVSLDQIKVVTSAVLFNEVLDEEDQVQLDVRLDPTINLN
jgi:uncharacterized protein Smg (DUF494 family)